MDRVRLLLVALVVSIAFGFASDAKAAPPTGWDSTIILRGQERSVVKSMPIEKRPNRPLHIYGNTIRRMEYRGGRQ
jgi:hypothetical protein